MVFPRKGAAAPRFVLVYHHHHKRSQWLDICLERMDFREVGSRDGDSCDFVY